jgi:clostripain
MPLTNLLTRIVICDRERRISLDKKIIWIVVIVVALLGCCCLAAVGGYFLFSENDPGSSGASSDYDLALTVTAIVEHNEQMALTSQPNQQPITPASTPMPDSPDQTWLVMLYMAGDNNLEEELHFDFNEAELVGSSSQVQIVAQYDRYAGFDDDFTGDGNWTSTKRFYIQQDTDMERIASAEIADLGEVDMSRPESLSDFLSWAMTSYPSDKYVLIMSDHGSGWLGGWNDDETGGNMFPTDLSAGLQNGLWSANVDRLDLIGFDACLMSQMEIAGTVAPYARYMVASEEYEHGIGWAYSSFLYNLSTNPGMSTQALATNIVDSFIDDDIVFYNLPNADQEIAKLFETQTLAAIDLDQYGNLTAALNDLAYKLQSIDQTTVAYARSYAQSFDNVFADEKSQDEIPPPYIDLGHFVQVIQSLASDNAEVSQAAANVLAAIDSAVIAERHGNSVPGATGLSIFFPNSNLYSYVGFEDSRYSYPLIAHSFASDTLWDDLLSYHYTQQAFEPAAETNALASKSAENFIIPGAGEVEFGEVQQTAYTIAANEIVNLSIDITGSNIAYVYTEISYYWEDDGSFLTADMDFVWAEGTKEIGGVYYPDWGTDTFQAAFEWEPAMFYLNDGTHKDFVLLYPLDYGPPDEPAIYAIDGVYKVANGNAEYEATMHFAGTGEMREIIGYSEVSEDLLAPFEITPQLGDEFYIYQEWFEEDEYVYYLNSEPFVYSGEDFTFEAYDADAGIYLVGFIVEDLEGNLFFSDYAEINVTERVE